MGPPHCGHVTGSKSARWKCSTGVGLGLGVAGGVTGINMGADGLFGSGGCVSSWKNDPKIMDRPISTKMPGHQCPFENIIRKINSQNKTGKGPRKCLGPCLNLLYLCIGESFGKRLCQLYIRSFLYKVALGKGEASAESECPREDAERAAIADFAG